MAYFLLQFNILLLLILYKFSKSKYFLYTIVLILILFSGFRYGIGVDYFSYENHFQAIKYGYESSLEIGIQFIVYLTDYIGTTQLAFFVFSLITVVMFFKYINAFSANYFISWIIFISYGTYYLGSFNLIKQYIAISIFAFSIKYIVNGNLLKYIISIVIASLFHLSALLLLPMYLLKIKFKFYHYFILFILFIFSLNAIEYLISFTKYSIYLDERWATSMISDRNISMTYLFIVINVLIISTKNFISNIKHGYVFVNMAFVSLIIISASLFIDFLPNMFFFRINNYFMISYIILITYYISNFNKFIKIIASTIIILLMYLYFTLTLIYKGEIYNLTPYETNFAIIK